jgi:hypothetical protein
VPATKINWVKARNEYVSDPTVSYMDIAKRYGVAKKTVESHAKRDGWVNARQKVGDEAESRLEERIVDDLAKIDDRHSQTYEVAQAISLELLNMALENIRSEKKDAKQTGRTYDLRGLPSFQQVMYLIQAVDTGVKGQRAVKGMRMGSPTELKHSGIVATVQLTPDQRERLIDAAITAREIIEG